MKIYIHNFFSYNLKNLEKCKEQTFWFLIFIFCKKKNFTKFSEISILGTKYTNILNLKYLFYHYYQFFFYWKKNGGTHIFRRWNPLLKPCFLQSLFMFDGFINFLIIWNLPWYKQLVLILISSSKWLKNIARLFFFVSCIFYSFP